MKRLAIWWRRIRGADVRSDVDDEIRFHFQERIDALVAEGLPAEAAAAKASQEFGNADEVRHRLTAIDARVAARRRWSTWADLVGQDLRYAVRALVGAPGFSFLVVITLGLGLGANGAIFSLVDQLLFRPPAGVQDAAELVRIHRRVPSGGANSSAVTVTPRIHYPGFHDIVTRLPPDADITAYADRRVPIGRGETPPMAHVAWVAPRYFSVLRVGPPALGRYPTDIEAAVESPTALVVISHAQWMARYGGDPAIIGSTIELARTPYTIIGVAARDFSGVDVDGIDDWMTIGSLPGPSEPWYRARNAPFLKVLLRAPGRSAKEIEEVVTAAYRAGAPPRESTFVLLAGPINESRGPGRPGSEVTIATRLIGVAALVLLIACANVANLLLTRSMQRRRGIAVRLALGSSRVRVARLFFVESLVLSMVAAGAALIVAWWGGTAMRHLLMPDISWAGAVLDARVVAFTAAAAIATAVLTGLPPALGASRSGLGLALKTGVRDGGLPRSRVRTALLVTQVALSLMLLVGAAAFVRSLRAVENIQTGYQTDRLLLVNLRYDDGKSRRDQTSGLLQDVLPRLRAHPGVEDAALSGMQPLGNYAMNTLFRQDGAEIPSAGELQPSYMAVSPGFFHTAGIDLIRGRDFSENDVTNAPPVMVVSESMARTLWPGQEAIGECLRIGRATEPCVSVVGVIENTHRDGLIDATDGRAPMYFVTSAQSHGEFATPTLALVRSASARTTAALAGALLSDLRGTLPAGVYASVAPITDSFRNQLRPWVLGSTLFSAFGLLALAVASVGTYSALSYAVARRTREMGIRMALGAPPLSLIRLVIAEGLLPVAAGVGAGIGLALASGRLIAALLYQTSAADPAVLAIAVFVMCATATAGCLVPALRASRVDPVAILRSE